MKGTDRHADGDKGSLTDTQGHIKTKQKETREKEETETGERGGGEGEPYKLRRTHTQGGEGGVCDSGENIFESICNHKQGQINLPTRVCFNGLPTFSAVSSCL